MKPLSLLQPTVFLMIGMPGAGKSYFARQFSENYSLPHISADRLRMEMFNEPAYTPAEQAIIHRVAGYMADELLRSKRSFIIDGLMGNVRTQRLNLERRARLHGFNLLTVWVQVDETTARTRSLKRNPNKTDDRYNPSMPEVAFTSLLKQLTPPTTENHVVISGKHAFAAQKAAVLRKVPRETGKVQSPAQRRAPSGAQASAPSETGGKKVITPTPTRHINRPDQRQNNSAPPSPGQRRISVSED